MSFVTIICGLLQCDNIIPALRLLDTAPIPIGKRNAFHGPGIVLSQHNPLDGDCHREPLLVEQVGRQDETGRQGLLSTHRVGVRGTVGLRGFQKRFLIGDPNIFTPEKERNPRLPPEIGKPPGRFEEQSQGRADFFHGRTSAWSFSPQNGQNPTARTSCTSPRKPSSPKRGSWRWPMYQANGQ